MIKRVIELMKSKAIFFSMFVCPSMSYWAYQTFIFCCCVVVIAYGLVSIDEKEFEKIILEQIGYTIGFFFIFYILQKRELKRFLNEQKMVLQQEQMTEVFNC